MANHEVRLLPLIGKSIVVHTVTYFIMGVLASTILDYKSMFASPHMACWMRQFPDPLIAAGPLLQPIRGLVFALVVYTLREVIFARKHGWLLLWWLLVALGILSTFGPAPGSLEGLTYTTIPIRNQLVGHLEVVPQAFLFALGLCYWVNHPEKRWFSVIMVAAFVIFSGFAILGVLSLSASA
jgi:hypothetical protein